MEEIKEIKEEKIEVVANLKKHWFQSKMVIFNGLTASGAFFMFALQEAHDLINNNLDWIKSSGIKTQYIFAILGLFGFINLILRFTTYESLHGGKSANKVTTTTSSTTTTESKDASNSN